MRTAVSVLLGLLVFGCTAQTDSSGGQNATGLTAPLRNLSPQEFAAQDRDCLQYPVDRLKDGTETWHADYVYFYLVNEKDGSIHLGDDGQPLASGLLHSQVVAFMEHQQPIPGTGWKWRVERIVRHLRNGVVVKDEGAVTVDDEDLGGILQKDRAARSG